MEKFNENYVEPIIDQHEGEGEEDTTKTNKLSDLVSLFVPEVMDIYVRESISTVLKQFPKVKTTNTLVTTLYHVLKSLYVDNKNHVILSAPTGTGKSVIGYMINFCSIYIHDRCSEPYGSKTFEEFKSKFTVQGTSLTTYTLTSSKILQEQIDSDINFFNMRTNLDILKGVKNYECTKNTEETGIYHNYSERYCSGMMMEEKVQLKCYNSCPYISQRYKVSNINNAILNYAYFLSVLKSGNNPFFGKRNLTICDEAHLIPDIVSAHFNIDLTMMQTNKLIDLYQSIKINFQSALSGTTKLIEKIPVLGEDGIQQVDTLNLPVFDVDVTVINTDEYLRENLSNLFKFFTTELSKQSDPLAVFEETYWKSFKNVVSVLETLLTENHKNSVFLKMYQKDINKLTDYCEFTNFTEILSNLRERPKDNFIESTEISVVPYTDVEGIIKAGRYKVFRHNIYDLSESQMCREHFITKVNKAVYMSATLGNIDEFGVLMGLTTDEYAGFRLPSEFDFSKSPIYLTNSGYLNYNNFESNIGKVLDDAIFICQHRHPEEKGIIHTSTFKIAQELKNKLNTTNLDKDRFLFYENSKEKELCIERMKNSDKPLIIIGPSLFEGIDLKDDLGRFNITIKAPYSGMSNYTRMKMERYPFWYQRVVLEKLEQSIGRTNRHVNDYSTNYLLDTLLNKLVFELPDHITSRVSFLRL